MRVCPRGAIDIHNILIRNKYNNEKITYQRLGTMYNLDSSMIGYIIRGDSWNYELHKNQ